MRSVHNGNSGLALSGSCAGWQASEADKANHMKTAIIIISNPQGGDESLARLFNALTLAVECKTKGDEMEITFIGTGTRWPAELARLDHPGNGLFNQVREHVGGASRACGQFWGATAGLEANEVHQIDSPASLRRYLAEDWKTLIF